jgi:hypothetical protein
MKLISITLLGLSLCTPLAWGSLVAVDNAGNYTSWANGNNLGSGFGAWALSGTANSGFFLGTSANNGTPTSGNINTSGKAWGLFANSGTTASAVRPFTGGSLAAGQQFHIQMDNGNIQSGGTVGFGLQNSSGVNRFEFYFVGGATTYTINIGGTLINTGISFTDDGLSLVFSQNSANGWALDVTPSGGSTSQFSGTLAASDISQLRLFNFNAGSGSSADAFYNNIQVVPEPTHVALGIFGGALLLGGGWQHWRRRRAGC